jgi:TPR repeat protein
MPLEPGVRNGERPDDAQGAEVSVEAQRLSLPYLVRGGLPALFIASLFLLSLLPRIATTPMLHASVVGASAVLAAWYLLLGARARVDGSIFSFDVLAVKSHYVQAIVQGSIYVYWANAWPWLGGQAPLIVAQILYLYAFDMLLSWTRGRTWRLGFGPIPIMLSTNFFLCFKDDWFYLQFAMISVGVLGKEFIRWRKDGRSAHIFNPSALGLFVFSIALIVSGRTDISWAQQIAIELGRPEHIYLYIFAVGLVVQYLFHVTLVTLSAAAALYVLNTVYTQATGVYWFLDSSIPIAVFLGLHLLVTDPATSPRTNLGRTVFGALYGAGVFAIYGLLGWAGMPTFYDKLLCVPILNLMVRALDRVGTSSPLTRLTPFAQLGRLGADRQNLVHMTLWIALFAWMYGTRFIGDQHPGREIAFWEQACTAQRRTACSKLYRINRDNCGAGDVRSCMVAGSAAETTISSEPLAPVHEFARACDLGFAEGCGRLVDSLDAERSQLLRQSCHEGTALDCYILGSIHLLGLGLQADHAAAFRYFHRSCDLRFAQGCGIEGDAYRYGVGVAKDLGAAARSYERGCGLSHAPSCVSLAGMLATGDGVPADALRATELRHKACRLDLTSACESGT